VKEEEIFYKYILEPRKSRGNIYVVTQRAKIIISGTLYIEENIYFISLPYLCKLLFSITSLSLSFLMIS